MPPTPLIQRQREVSQPIAQLRNCTDTNNVYCQDQINVNGHLNQAEQVNAENGSCDGQINACENEQNAENEVVYG